LQEFFFCPDKVVPAGTGQRMNAGVVFFEEGRVQVVAGISFFWQDAVVQ
jgi:hypothetical protein